MVHAVKYMRAKATGGWQRTCLDVRVRYYPRAATTGVPARRAGVEDEPREAELQEVRQ